MKLTGTLARRNAHHVGARTSEMEEVSAAEAN